MTSPALLIWSLVFVFEGVMTTEAPDTTQQQPELFPGAPPIQFSTLTGPTFMNENGSIISVVEGTTAMLPCVIKNLHKHSVSWARGHDIRLLTNSFLTYTSDTRFVPVNPGGAEQWFLKIHYVRKTDAGDYLCQVSTSPPKTLVLNLKVQEAVARVYPSSEVYVKTGSRLEVMCQVEGCPLPALLSWTRSGIAQSTPPPHSFMKKDGESSVPVTQLKLLRLKASAADSGTYTCTSTCTQPINATVHVLRGEELAAMQHHNSSPRTLGAPSIAVVVVATVWIMTLLPLHCLIEQDHTILPDRHKRTLNCSSCSPRPSD